MLHEARDKFSSLPRGTQRTLIALFLFIDANILGTSNGWGILNVLDAFLGGGLPNDLVWLLQVIESITAGFILIKVLFDDVKRSIFRTMGLILSPLFMVLVTFRNTRHPSEGA